MVEEKNWQDYPVKLNEEYQVQIVSRGSKGDGVAFIDNLAIIVPGTKVGDYCKVKITNTLPKVAFGEKISPE